MNRATRRQFLAATASAVGISALNRLGIAAAPARPNIIIIVADDLGYADLGCQGCRDIPTPNIDSIAANGLRCTAAYVSCPVCSPTRAGLLTGRYQQRFGHEFNPGPAQAASEQFGLPLTEVTLADRLKEVGYATGLVGKWHLGYKPQYHPLKRGFDEFYGFLGGAHAYLNNKAGDANPIYHGTTPLTESEYLTDALGRRAIAFVERHKNRPFYLHLTFNAVHLPQQATEKYLRRFENIPDPTRRKMAAQLSAMDDAIGGVIARLKEIGAYENTLIFFISDNGGPTPRNGSKNTPFSGTKGQVREGGIRVPFLLQWNNRLPIGKTYPNPLIALDIHATCLAAADWDGQIAPDKRLDGANLLPFLRGEQEGLPHDKLFWRFGPQSAVRDRRYKLERINGIEQLYDLDSDPGEKQDLLSHKPEVAKVLRDAWATWNAQLVEPLWKRPNRPGQRIRAARSRPA